jgi:hypothetical protein
VSVECIQDDESRLFLTTVGSWEGDIVWTALAWAAEGGAGKIIVPANGGTVTVQLPWPAIIVGVTLPSWDVATVTSTVAIGFDLPATELTMQVEITDGNYSYKSSSYTSYNAQYWESPSALGNIEHDWSITGTVLKVKLSNPLPDPVTAYIDAANFLETYPPEPPLPSGRIDYLPIMGVG